MLNNYNVFLKHLENEDKDKAVMFILDLLEEDKDILKIYEEYLIPALSNFACLLEDKEICIWKEHTRTSIIRTILEATYPFIIKSKEKSNGKSILTVCPKEEYHEIGAIIAANYFNYVGFNARYIGANTPSEEIISAIKVLNPDYLAFSVTNYYNLIEVKKLIDTLRKEYPKLEIILGGQAFANPDSLKQISYDYHLNSLEEIVDFRDEVLR